MLVYVLSLLSLSTLVIKMLYVWSSSCEAILFVNCCIGRYSIYKTCTVSSTICQECETCFTEEPQTTNDEACNRVTRGKLTKETHPCGQIRIVHCSRNSGSYSNYFFTREEFKFSTGPIQPSHVPPAGCRAHTMPTEVDANFLMTCSLASSLSDPTSMYPGRETSFHSKQRRITRHLRDETKYPYPVTLFINSLAIRQFVQCVPEGTQIPHVTIPWVR